MLNLLDEFRSLINLLSDKEIEYALCGGLAMAVYGKARTTIDIDLLVLSESLDDVIESIRNLGYALKAQPMTFAKGSIEIRRISKLDPDTGEPLILDLLLVTPAIKKVWDDRQQISWEGGIISVVSRDGLIALKSLRMSGQDIDDINRLKETEFEG